VPCYQLTDRFRVSADLDTTWRFFSTAENLTRITPAWLGFTMDMPTPVTIVADTTLDYKIRWMAVPIRWRTKIIEWSPPRQFIDLQVRGPYALWHHQHTFTPGHEQGGGIECFDRVIYRLPFGPIGTIAHGLTVRNQLLEIFRHRRKVIGEVLGGFRALQEDVRITRL
jgi:ligand-binding SRPBCC domain-containing protein